MDFAQQQRNPMKHLAGITFVVIIHVVIIWALITGLAHKVVEMVKKPIETKIIEEVKPPPPPEIKLPPPPKMIAPPPPFVPPPEVTIQTPPPPNTITVQTTTPPKPQEYQATPPVATANTGPPAKTLAGTCNNVRQLAAETPMPRAALRSGVDHGEVTVRFTVTAGGEVINPEIVGSSNRVFNETALGMARQLKCTSPGHDQEFSWQIGFKTSD